MQGNIAAMKSSLVIENDLSIVRSEHGSFNGVFDRPPYCTEQPRIVRESTPMSFSSTCGSDPFPPSPLTPQSPTSPDFSFLSCASSPGVSIELNSLMSSTSEQQLSSSQAEASTLQGKRLFH